MSGRIRELVRELPDHIEPDQAVVGGGKAVAVEGAGQPGQLVVQRWPEDAGSGHPKPFRRQHIVGPEVSGRIVAEVGGVLGRISDVGVLAALALVAAITMTGIGDLLVVWASELDVKWLRFVDPTGYGLGDGGGNGIRVEVPADATGTVTDMSR